MKIAISCNYISYEDSIIELKIFTFQGGMIFARKVDDADNVISFDDIINNRENPNKKEIDKSLDLFGTYVSNLMDRGIPETTLRNTFEERIQKNNDEKEKKHVKK